MTKQNEFINSIINGDIEKVILLLKHPKVNPVHERNRGLKLAVQRGHFNIVELLLSDQRINPADYGNKSVYFAYHYGHYEILYLLWQDHRVQKFLEINDKRFYDKLKDKYLKQALNNF